MVAVVGDGRVERGALSDLGRRYDHGSELRAGHCGGADALPLDDATELLATT